MTPCFDRNNVPSAYDEKAVAELIKSAEWYVRAFHRPPDAVAVNLREYEELRKAEAAGVKLIVLCKGKWFRINFFRASACGYSKANVRTAYGYDLMGVAR